MCARFRQMKRQHFSHETRERKKRRHTHNKKKTEKETKKSLIISATIVNRKILHFLLHFVMCPTTDIRHTRTMQSDRLLFTVRSECRCLFCIRKGKSPFFKIKDIYSILSLVSLPLPPLSPSRSEYRSVPSCSITTFFSFSRQF